MKLFDTLLSMVLLAVFGWLILVSLLLASIDTASLGLFVQKRVGKHGKPFNIFKIRTMHAKTSKISKFGMFMRKSKIDELPQLVNILFGQMSFVGPRPDILGYYDKLQGEDRKILELNPGLCSWTALKYIDEETLLRKQKYPLQYNDEVIFPDKVRMNLDYYYNRSFKEDVKIMWATAKRIIQPRVGK